MKKYLLPLPHLRNIVVSRVTPFFLAGCLFAACSEELDLDESLSDSEVPTGYRSADHDALKREFGQMLVSAVTDEPSVRELIKSEALKMFNNDYEVLYHMVKDRKVDAERTFREVLMKYSKGDSQLDKIESELPLLTILVPELPEGSFSAEIWDIETEIPAVALRIESEQGVPILAGAEELYLPHHLFPGFPVIVVKDNERVTIDGTIDDLTFDVPGSSYSYRFTDINFDNIHPKVSPENIVARIGGVDQKLLDARAIMDPINGWHRDHIY